MRAPAPFRLLWRSFLALTCFLALNFGAFLAACQGGDFVDDNHGNPADAGNGEGEGDLFLDSVGGLDSPDEVTLPFSVTTRLEVADDVDCYRFTTPIADVLSFTVDSTSECSFQNPAIWLFHEDAIYSYERLGFSTTRNTACVEQTQIVGPGQYLVCLSGSADPEPTTVLTLSGMALDHPLTGACPGGFEMRENAEVQIIQDCTSIGRSLNVSFLGTTDSLLGLEGLTTIDNVLFLNGEALLSTDGLSGLESVGTLVVSSSSINDLSALANTTILHTLSITRTNALTDLSAFAAHTDIGNVRIRSNDSLTDTSGLAAIATIDGLLGLKVYGNDVLPTLNLPALDVVSDLSIENNPQLYDLLVPLLSTVSGDFTVVDNPLLPQCKVDALIAQLQAAGGIGGTITTSGNDTNADCF